MLKAKKVKKRSLLGKSSILIVFLVVIGILLLGGLVFSLFAKSPMSPSQSTQNIPAQQIVDTNPNHVTLWAWNTAADALQQLLPDFNKVYPNITVTIVKIPYNDANAKFRSAIATGVGFPDIWDSEGPVTPEYIQKGALLDITDKAAQYKDSFVGYKVAEVTNKAGRWFALPWDSAPVGLFYRRDMFKQAGIDPNSILTWDDYIAVGKIITRAPDRYMTFMSTTADVQDTFGILLSQEGGSPFDAMGNPTFNSPQGIAAVTLMKKIFDAGITKNIPWWDPAMFDAIKNGKIASLMQGVWMGGQIKTTAPATAGEWGIIPLPAVQAGGVRTAVRGGSNLAITAMSHKADAAWKFIQFAVASKDSQIQMYKHYDIFPALKSAYTDPIFNTPNSFYGNQLTSRLFITAQDSLPGTYHYGTRYNDAMNVLSAEIIQVINNHKTAQQALGDADKEVKAIIY